MNDYLDFFSVVGSLNVEVLAGKETVLQVTPEVLDVTEDFGSFDTQVRTAFIGFGLGCNDNFYFSTGSPMPFSAREFPT